MPGVNYRILFKIELLSDYFVDERARHLLVVPTEETAALLRGQNILWRQLNNKFILLIRTDDTGKPFIPVDPLSVFRFYLEVDHHFFFQYSGVAFDPTNSRRYYFSNRNNNAVSSANPLYNKKYITSVIDSLHDTTINYTPGDLVLNNNTDKEIFEAVHQGTNKPLTEQHYWFRRTTATTPRQYVHKKDLRTMRDHTLPIRLAAGTQKAVINIMRENIDTGLFDIPADNDIQEFEAPVQDIVIDLTTLSPGNYRVNIAYNGTTLVQDVYVNKRIFNSNVLGMIEIFSNLPAASDYAFIDAGGVVKEPEVKYTLRFANRLAYWKYIPKTTSVKNVKEKNNTFSFNAVGTSFVSSKPLAFHEKPYNIVIDFQKEISSPHVDIEGIKNGSYHQVRKVSVLVGEEFDCSEIYLNY